MLCIELCRHIISTFTPAANEVVHYHYMLTPCVECLWYIKFLTLLFEARSVDKMKGQRTSYGAEHTHSLVQQICV